MSVVGTYADDVAWLQREFPGLPWCFDPDGSDFYIDNSDGALSQDVETGDYTALLLGGALNDFPNGAVIRDNDETGGLCWDPAKPAGFDPWFTDVLKLYDLEQILHS